MTTFERPVITKRYVKEWYDHLDVDKTLSWDRYGSELANGIAGWIFSDEEIEDAGKNGKLIHLDYEFGKACSLNCVYCFRTEDERDGERERLMSDDTWVDVLKQCKALGLKSIKLLGQGELTEHKRFLWAIETICNMGITPLLFTAAHIFADDEKCMKIHGMTGQELANRLYELGASVMIKVNSFDPEIQDGIVGVKGYTQKRNLGLERLLKAGFANHNPTRIGLEVAMMKPDKEELIDIYNLKFLLNVYIDLDPFMPCGLTKECDNLSFEFNIDEKMEIYKTVYLNNIKYGMPFRGISPYAGGQVCSQLGYGLYINLYGKVYACPGAEEQLGDIHQESVEEIFNKAKIIKHYRCNKDHGCPFREASRILYKGWEDDIRNAIAPMITDKKLFHLTLSE